MQDSLVTEMHCFVTCRILYYNFLSYVISNYNIKQFWRIQTSATPIVRTYHHIIRILKINALIAGETACSFRDINDHLNIYQWYSTWIFLWTLVHLKNLSMRLNASPECAFDEAPPTLCNRLTVEIKSASSLETF